jgi:hypothetical protein
MLAARLSRRERRSVFSALPSELLLPSYHVGDDDQSDRLMEASKCGGDIKTDGVYGPNRFSLKALTAGTDRFPPPAEECGVACSSDSVRVFSKERSTTQWVSSLSSTSLK